MKKKIIALALVVAMLGVAVISGTLAYFQDTDDAVNVFVSGSVDITLHEDNVKDEQITASDDAAEKYLDDDYTKWIAEQDFWPSFEYEKDAWLENTGANPAFVRMYVLWPEDMTDMLTVTWDDSVDTAWVDVVDDITDPTTPVTLDMVKVEIDGEPYVGRCLVYTTALAKDALTPDTVTAVKLKDDVTCEVLTDGTIKYSLGSSNYFSTTGQIPVRVYAEAGQTRNGSGTWDGNPNLALNEMFGVPGSYLPATAPIEMVSAGSSTDIQSALANGDNVILTDDITTDYEFAKTNLIAGGSAGMIQSAGTVIDGAGKTFTAEGVNRAAAENNPWSSRSDYASVLYTEGGTIKNITLTGAFRGIFSWTLKEDLYLENVVIDGPTYTINTDDTSSGYSIYANNCEFYGWTSYSEGHTVARFTDCKFGEGAGYAFMRPFSVTEFIGCEFEAGYEISAKADVTFENCTIGGVAVTDANVADFVSCTGTITVK